MRESYATWSLLIEPGDQIAGYLRKQLGVEKSLEILRQRISARELAVELPEDNFLPPKHLETLQESLECYWRRLDTVNLDKSLSLLSQQGGFLLTPESECWPKALADLSNAEPPALWIIGEPKTFCHSPSLAVVGSRIASDYGLGITRDLVRYSVSKQWSIISGGALGIDAMAHLTAIDSKGKTIAFMAGGLDRLYPKQNLELFELIQQNGALVSEMAPGVAPSRWRFLQRNRLIAALGKATVVVEASFRSGSINTAGHANELARPVGAIPGRIDSVRSAGCHRLIREGRAELISTPQQLSELMGFVEPEPEQLFRLTANQTRTLDAVGNTPVSIAEIATSAGLTIFEANQATSELQAQKLLVRNSFGWYKP
ncbi:MAG: DNA-protecting protein DprA [Micrococcales bacterium]|nr:DNA-protecting protein DprA [Micrococcales bacterium]NBT47166.1 DNA-protecting protein DprA [Actinomycetota bacterium]